MTSARLTARSIDPAVPSLDLVLEAGRLGRWLERRGEVLVNRCYLRYKPDTSCVAALELESGRAFLYGVAEPVRPKLDKLVEAAPPGSIRAVDRRLRLVLATVEADRDLPALRNLPHAIARLGLDRSDDRPAPSSELTVLVHKPQRRLVGLLHPDAGAAPDSREDVVLRAYRKGHSVRAVQRHRAAGRVKDVRTARVLAKSSRYALLAMEHLPGQTLDALVSAGTATPAILQATGLALAQVHADPLRGKVDPWPMPAQLPETTVSAAAYETAALISRLCPRLARRVASILEVLAATAPAGTERVFCHGDFSADQVVVDAQGRPGLIDWDSAGIGDPATDLATVQAAGLGGDQLANLLDGYGQLRTLPRHLDWHLAQARLMRAADPFRSATEAWLDAVEANVTTVEADLGRLRQDRSGRERAG